MVAEPFKILYTGKEESAYDILCSGNKSYGKYKILIEEEKINEMPILNITQSMTTCKEFYVKTCKLKKNGEILEIKKTMTFPKKEEITIKINDGNVEIFNGKRIVRKKYKGLLYAVTTGEVLFRCCANSDPTDIVFRGITNNGFIMNFRLVKLYDKNISTPSGEWECCVLRLTPAGLLSNFVKPFDFYFTKDNHPQMFFFCGKLSPREAVMYKQLQVNTCNENISI